MFGCEEEVFNTAQLRRELPRSAELPQMGDVLSVDRNVSPTTSRKCVVSAFEMEFRHWTLYIKKCEN